MIMTAEHKKILDRINAYSEKVLADIDPQKTPVSYQLQALRPVMEEIANETGKSVEDIFILYMDLASEAGVQAEAKFQEDMNNGNAGFSSIANNLD